jgi:hypothetical protein
MAGTALTYITRAFENLNVFQPGVTLPAPQSAQALVMLNLMMGTWAQQLTSYTLGAANVPLVANKGTYTWGVGGDIVAEVPANQNKIRSASLLLGNTLPVVAVPLAVLTDDMAAAIQIKDLSSTQPTTVYFYFSSTQPLARLNVWPIPNNAVHSVTVYYDLTFGPFADLNTTIYQFPVGYDEAIVYNLERRLAGPYGRDLPAEDAILARETFANIMRVISPPRSGLPGTAATTSSRGITK